jgi:hypothetical protein
LTTETPTLKFSFLPHPLTNKAKLNVKTFPFALCYDFYAISQPATSGEFNNIFIEKRERLHAEKRCRKKNPWQIDSGNFLCDFTSLHKLNVSRLSLEHVFCI